MGAGGNTGGWDKQESAVLCGSLSRVVGMGQAEHNIEDSEHHTRSVNSAMCNCNIRGYLLHSSQAYNV
jgi:hypothetical protein